MKTAVIVLPTYNEAGNIKELITKIFDIAENIPNWNIEILVNDSSSPDKTADIVKLLQKKYKKLHLMMTGKTGLGTAYTEGFKYAIEKLNAFVVFTMDADLQHQPKEIPEFLKAIEQGADIVVGSRRIPGGSIPDNWGLDRKILSNSANVFLRLGFMNSKVTEWTNGYRAVKSWLIKDAMSHISKYSGYVFQIALLDFALKKNAVLKEIPSNFLERKAGQSKISFGGYIFTIITYVFAHSSFIRFCIVGGTGFFVDFGIFYSLTKFAHFVSWHANLISTETAVITNYLLNNFWSFSHKKVEHALGSYVRSFVKYNIVSSGSIIIQTLGVEIMKHYLGAHNIYLYKILIIIFIVIPYSYFFFNRFIWKDKK